uniref:Uncharacterized protein n=1 Tax=Arundo donax TaxID=35708 RepID=A0A0A9HSG6_ARUDO
MANDLFTLMISVSQLHAIISAFHSKNSWENIFTLQKKRIVGRNSSKKTWLPLLERNVESKT